jgi:hypothetical protein
MKEFYIVVGMRNEKRFLLLLTESSVKADKKANSFKEENKESDRYCDAIVINAPVDVDGDYAL